jgi:predicted RNA methylase
VGSGCGVLTAAAAVLVGRSGAAVGIDIKVSRVTTELVQLSQ